MAEPPWPIFAQDKIRFVGEIIAVVIAESVNKAKDACELIEFDYEELDAVVSPEKALNGDIELIWEDIPNNQCFDWELGDKNNTDDAFEKAQYTASIEILNNRLFLMRWSRDHILAHTIKVKMSIYFIRPHNYRT